MVRIFRDEASALRRMQELARQNGLKYSVLHRTFGDEHRYIVGRWVRKGTGKRFVATA